MALFLTYACDALKAVMMHGSGTFICSKYTATVRSGIIVFMLQWAVILSTTGICVATPDGKTVEFQGPTMGKVIFDSKTHIKRGLVCRDCHQRLFQMKRGVFHMTREEHGTEKGCGACHNGSTAFNQKETANCARCHRKDR